MLYAVHYIEMKRSCGRYLATMNLICALQESGKAQIGQKMLVNEEFVRFMGTNERMY